MIEGQPENPYAPPVESADAFDHAPAAAGRGGLSLSGEGWDIVSSLAKWMRIVSTLQYVGAVLIGLAAVVLLVTNSSLLRSLNVLGGAGVVTTGLIMIGMAALFFLAARWLRHAARHFYEGVLADAEQPLAQGFRKLRLYLILYGTYSLLGLASDVIKLVRGER